MTGNHTVESTRDGTTDELERARRTGIPFLVHALDRRTVTVHDALSTALSEQVSVVVGRGSHHGSREEGRRLELADATVSTEHARLTVERDEEEAVLLVEDLGSRNGTVVDGQRVASARVRDGGWLAVGAHTFVWRLVPARWLEFVRSPAPDDRQLIGQSVACYELLGQIARVAETDIPVILEGPTGCGKEVVARELHARSGRGGPFVGVNCAAIPENLIESELFGHVRGAFSGAVQAKEGLVAAADGGTLLLDEIGEMPSTVQVRLLRVLQEREVLPLGETRPRKVDVRVVTASHRPLEDLVRRGEFRADLHARLHGLRLSIPPLHERIEDVGLLFAEGIGRAGGVEPKRGLTASAAEALFACAWPYNVRQVMQGAAVAVALAGDEPIGREHLQGLDLAAATAATDSSPGAPGDAVSTVGAGGEQDESRAAAAGHLLLASRRRGEDPEGFAAALRAMMDLHDGKVRAVAAAVGLSRMHVYRWLNDIGWKR